MVNILTVEDEKNLQDIICEYLTLGNDEEAGEPALLELLFGFSCPKNSNVGKRQIDALL